LDSDRHLPERADVEKLLRFVERPGLYVGSGSYQSIAGFLHGYDYARGGRALWRFDEWLEKKYRAPGRLAWSGKVFYLLDLPPGIRITSEELLKRPEIDELATKRLRELVREFLLAKDQEQMGGIGGT